MAPSEFWGLSPEEFWWEVDAKVRVQKKLNKKSKSNFGADAWNEARKIHSEKMKKNG